MAEPNFAAVFEMIAFAAKVMDEHESYTSAATTGLLATTEALRNDLEGDWGQLVKNVVAGIRSSANQPLTRDGARALMTPLLRQLAVAIDLTNPEGPIEEVWDGINDYMVTNSQSLNDPEDTVDTTATAGGSNVGNATVFVLTYDENGEKLGHITDTWALLCTADARTLGRTQVEQWTYKGTDARPDDLAFTGTGLSESLRTLSGDLSTSYVLNPSFNSYGLDGSNNLTALGGWTQSGATLATNLAINLVDTARAVPGDSKFASLQFNADETIVQDLVAVKGAQIAQDVPFMISIAVGKVGVPTGTIRLRMSGVTGSGGKTVTLAHTSMTGGSAGSVVFDRLQLTGTNGVDCWPANWNANDLKLQISLESGASIDASNYFLVDDIVFTPLTRVGDYGDARSGKGSMGIHVGITGDSIPAVKGDSYVLTDTLNATRATNHWALTKKCQFGAFPMVTGGLETIADK